MFKSLLRVLSALIFVGSLPANASLVTLDFNDFATPWNGNFSLPYRADYTPYIDSGVTLSAATVLETYWANQYPDALLANYALNGSGLLSVTNPFEITTGGRFKLDSVDLLNGLYNRGMSVVFDSYLQGQQTASVQVYFPPAQPDNFAAYIGDMSWLFDFNSTALGVMDRLVVTGISGTRGHHGFFADNLVVQSVPEPETLTLLALGLCGMWLARRRRNTLSQTR